MLLVLRAHVSFALIYIHTCSRHRVSSYSFYQLLWYHPLSACHALVAALEDNCSFDVGSAFRTTFLLCFESNDPIRNAHTRVAAILFKGCVPLKCPSVGLEREIAQVVIATAAVATIIRTICILSSATKPERVCPSHTSRVIARAYLRDGSRLGDQISFDAQLLLDHGSLSAGPDSTRCTGTWRKRAREVLLRAMTDNDRNTEAYLRRQGGRMHLSFTRKS
jgi:hypothetical protein